jgi:hypothetical protein
LTIWGARYCLRLLIKEGAIFIDKESIGNRPRTLRIGGQYLPLGGAVGTTRGGSRTPPNKEEPSLSTTVKIPIEIPYTVQKRNEAEREDRIREAKSRGFASDDGWKTCYRKEMV